MPSNLSPNAKARVAVGVAVVQAGIAAYQATARGGRFTWWDVVPIAAAVASAASVDHVENTLSRPAAKAFVHLLFSAVSAVTTALAALLATEPSGVSLAKVATVGLGALLVWYVPEAGPTVQAVEGEVEKGAPAAQVLATAAEGVALVAGDVSPLMRPDLPTAAAPAATPRQVDAGLPNSTWSPKPVAAGSTADPAPAPASTPTPIGDAVTGPPTQPFPAIPPQTPATPAPAVVPVPTA